MKRKKGYVNEWIRSQKDAQRGNALEQIGSRDIFDQLKHSMSIFGRNLYPWNVVIAIDKLTNKSYILLHAKSWQHELKRFKVLTNIKWTL